MPSKVFFSKDFSRVIELFEAAGFDRSIAFGDEVALKIHFGEPGNTAYLKPQRVRPIFEQIAALGGKPFYTDCNVLYKSPRDNTREHLEVARKHGYTNVIIPEEDDYIPVEVNLKHFKRVFLGGTAVRANVILALTHFKGHEMTGFGGALKNMGMGLGTRRGKLKMHQDCEHCPELKTCRKNISIEPCWVGSPALVQEKMVEYVLGISKDKKDKIGYFNFLIDISPNCDCYDHNDPPLVPDIGILASTDPVAIDQASVDLVNQAAKQDIFRRLYPSVDWEVQLNYAEKIGLGSRKYELMVE